MFKVIIAGSRGYSDYDMMKNLVDHYIAASGKDEIEIVSGGARGADKLGEQYAAKRGYPMIQFLAEWDTLGNIAGYVRNESMAKYASKHGGMLIAFWDGQSRGTKHMIDLARMYRIKVIVIRYDKW